MMKGLCLALLALGPVLSNALWIRADYSGGFARSLYLRGGTPSKGCVESHILFNVYALYLRDAVCGLNWQGGVKMTSLSDTSYVYELDCDEAFEFKVPF